MIGNSSTSATDIFDVVIRTQKEFEELTASPDWFGANSVCFIGDGGTLKFACINPMGVIIPKSVKQIQGVNSATIEFYNRQGQMHDFAALYYQEIPSGPGYIIRDMIVNCYSHVTGVVCFKNCTNLINCSGTGTSPNDLVTTSVFTNCIGLVNCTSGSPAIGGNNHYGFVDCAQLINCSIDTSLATGDVTGFQGCMQLTNCTGNAITSGTVGIGFNGCVQLTNCAGTGIGAINGIGFRSCHYINGCKQGSGVSTTGFLIGNNTKVDTLTVMDT